MEEAITDGITQGKALYQKTIEIMLMKINNLSCEQLIDKQVKRSIVGTKRQNKDHLTFIRSK